MLFIKGIYLLLSHLPTSHTTVHAVRHTAVSCFYTLRRVASCFQPSLRDTSLLFYCRIPSYRVNREFLFGHLTTKDSQGSSHLLLHCTIQSFPIDNPCLGYYDLCWLLTTSFTPSWYIEYLIFTMRSWDLLGYGLILSILYPLHLHQPFRIAIGLWFVWQSHPWSYALYEVSVR